MSDAGARRARSGLGRGLNALLGDVAQARRTLDEHTQLCLHIRQGDAVAASAVMTAHMTRARAFCASSGMV